MSPAKEIRVTKRDGRLEPLDINKIHQVVEFACHGLDGVSPSEVELRSRLHFFDGMKTSEIQETLIRAARDLISEDAPNYQYVAGRLVSYAIRKEVFGTFTPEPLLQHIERVVQAGFYDSALLEKYTPAEIQHIGSFIDHDRDDHFTYAAMEQWRTKYLVRNRVTGKIFETPQLAYMTMAMVAFADEPRAIRSGLVVDFYNATQRLSLPTPIMAGLRTPQKQFSSCVLVETDDSLDSINATAAAIVKYVSQKAGIGVGAGRIRAVGSAIRNGDATHTGIVPFLKHFYSAVASCSQGGVRKGSATVYYPIWHLEFEDLIVLKNNKGTEETRIRHMDYGVQINRFLYERLITGGNITLMSPNAVPGLYEAFFNDQEKFKELYEAAEADPKIRKKTLSAIEVFSALISERKDTGRIYVQHVDHANQHSPFIETIAPIRQSNLCAEIDLPTVPLNDIHDENGQIALCTLAAMDWSAYSSPTSSVMREDAALLVRFLDNILSYQNYPVKAAETSTRLYRPLGIGITNFAHWMAKNDHSYANPSQEDLENIARWADAWSYNLYRASVNLAKERGPCDGWRNLKISKGIVPYETATRHALQMIEHVIDKDAWSNLASEAQQYGIRNATLMACMPCETSALIGNHTNGIEPIRAFVATKKNKDMVVKQVAPGFPRLRKKYDLLWDMGPTGYLTIAGILQVFIDQGISVNTSYNPKHFENEEIPMSVLLKDLLYAYKMGHKQLYYNNTNDQAGELDIAKPTPVQTTSVAEPEDECASCKL